MKFLCLNFVEVHDSSGDWASAQDKSGHMRRIRAFFSFFLTEFGAKG